MSLRYRLDKERFKGKKLPPKVRTNEDHISEDQRGSDASLDDPLSDGGMKHTLKQKLAQESEQFSKRGIFSGLNKLKDYADEQDQKESEEEKTGQKVKKVRRKKKKKAATVESESVAEEPQAEIVDVVDSPASETNEALPASETEDQTEVSPPVKKKGIFKRVKDHFFPSIHGEEPEPTLRPASARSAYPVDMISPSDVVEEARRLQTDVPEEEYPQDKYPPVENEPEETYGGKEYDRRNLIKQSIHMLAKPAVDKVQTKIDKVNSVVDKVTKRPPLLRPPGSISEKAFLQACSRCDKCSNACPKDAIKKVPKKMGWIIMDTPFIDPMKVPCVMCDDLPCITACEDEALLPVASKFEAKMGYVILDKKHCVAYGDGFCQQCVIDCPIPGAISQKNGLPTFHRDICTGCGVCVRSCATVNMPVALKVKPQMVIDAQQQKKEREQAEAEMAIQLEIERKRIQDEQAALKAEQAALAKEKGWDDEDEG